MAESFGRIGDGGMSVHEGGCGVGRRRFLERLYIDSKWKKKIKRVDWRMDGIAFVGERSGQIVFTFKHWPYLSTFVIQCLRHRNLCNRIPLGIHSVMDEVETESDCRRIADKSGFGFDWGRVQTNTRHNCETSFLS